MWQMLCNCDSRHYYVNKSRMVRLAEYSRDCLKILRGETGIRYEGRQGGTLQLFRTAQQFANAQRDIAVLRDEGVPYALLEANELVNAEPALSGVVHKLSGGLRLPNDETCDCQLFTLHLAAMVAEKGVASRYNCQIGALVRINGVSCGREIVRSDAYVMALGSYFHRHAKECGVYSGCSAKGIFADDPPVG